MKYVKCLYTEVNSRRLTLNKIYEVLDYFIDGDDNYVEIIDNTGDKAIYSVYKNWFEDATVEMRDKKLNDLGI
jgi:hypothetical protein